MRHRKAGVKLNRTSSHRKAMFRNMVTSLFKHERIRTTDVKAKELRSWADHLIRLAKRGDLHARRQALSIMQEKSVVYKLFAEAEERFGKIAGGYTRVVKLGFRRGDAARMSLVELVDAEKTAPKTPKKEKPAPAPAAADTESAAGSADGLPVHAESVSAADEGSVIGAAEGARDDAAATPAVGDDADDAAASPASGGTPADEDAEKTPPEAGVADNAPEPEKPGPT